MDISQQEMYAFSYQAAMREMKHKEKVQPLFIDDLSFTEMWTKLDMKVS